MSLSMQLSRWWPSFTRPLKPLLQPLKLHPLLKPYGPVRTPMGRFGRTLFLGGALGLATLTPWQTPWPVVQCEGVVQPVSESAKVKDIPVALTLPGGKDAKGTPPPSGPKGHPGGFGRIAVAMLCWSFFASVWFVSITMPAALMWSVATAKWKVMTALLATYCFPHLITIPSLPRSATHAFWGGLQGWFPEGLEVIHVGEPEPEPQGKGRKRLFCIHPHGVYTLGALALPDHLPEVRLCIAPYLYHFAPVFRVVAQLLGVKLGSTGPKDLKQLMEKENSPMAIVPGGFEEATVTCRFTERVYLKTRAGFIKYALRHGYDLVPCFTVGDSDMFSNPQGAWRFRWFLNQLSIPAVLPFGFPILPLLPKRVHVRLAIGPPLHLPRIENPTREEVEKHRKRYLAALEATYEEAIRGTASAGRPLEVW